MNKARVTVGAVRDIPTNTMRGNAAFINERAAAHSFPITKLDESKHNKTKK